MTKNSFDGFLEDAAQKSRKARGTCSIARFLEDLKPGVRGQIEEAMQRPEITTSAIVEALNQRSEPHWNMPRVWAWRTHRAGKCSCGAS